MWLRQKPHANKRRMAKKKNKSIYRNMYMHSVVGQFYIYKDAARQTNPLSFSLSLYLSALPHSFFFFFLLSAPQSLTSIYSFIRRRSTTRPLRLLLCRPKNSSLLLLLLLLPLATGKTLHTHILNYTYTKLGMIFNSRTAWLQEGPLLIEYNNNNSHTLSPSLANFYFICLSDHHLSINLFILFFFSFYLQFLSKQINQSDDPMTLACLSFTIISLSTLSVKLHRRNNKIRQSRFKIYICTRIANTHTHTLCW